LATNGNAGRSFKKYLAELKKNKAVDEFIKAHQKDKLITLLFLGKDEKYTHALVLQQFLSSIYSG
jgi:uncharacterized protein YeaO (DUF488 family)